MSKEQIEGVFYIALGVGGIFFVIGVIQAFYQINERKNKQP
jgi:hypothetical protein